jgi:hypothetical protein
MQTDPQPETYNYNTSRSKMVIPEYGRNIQSMVEHVLTLKDRTERNIAAQSIIKTMAHVQPGLKHHTDFQNILWVHLHIMSGYALDVDYPCELPSKQEIEQKPEKLNYPQTRLRYKTHGKLFFEFFNTVKDTKDPEEKKQALMYIANAMKRTYIERNREYLDDSKLFEHIAEVSKGEISFAPGTKLVYVAAPHVANRPTINSKNAKKKKMRRNL